MRRWLKAVGDRIAGIGGQGLSLVSSWLANATWLIETRFLPLAQKAYGQNEVLYACLRLLCQAVPEAPLASYIENADGEREPVKDRAHPLVSLIRRPNELMTEYEFWELTTLHTAIVGRSTWWKERDRVGRIIALWPLRPDRVGPLYSTSNKPGERVLSGYSYLQPGTNTPIPIPRRDMLAFNLPDPAGESGGIVEGLGPVAVLARQVAADNEATKFVGALLANYAAPTIALRVKGKIHEEAEVRLIKAMFRSDFGGSNQGTPAVVDADTEIQQIGFSLRDLEFPEIRKIAESRISASLGVPAVLVGLASGLQTATYNNVSGMRRYFAETTLANLWRRYQDQYQSDVVVEFGEELVVEFDTSKVKALAGQRAEAIAPIAEAYSKGAATRAEYRQALGLTPNDVDDVYFVPNNATVAPSSRAEQEIQRTAEAERQAVAQAAALEKQAQALEQAQAQAAVVEAERTLQEAKAHALKVVNPREQDEESLIRALNQGMTLLSKSVARRLARGEDVPDEEIAEAFGSIIEPQLVEAAGHEMERLAAEVGVGFDVPASNAQAAKWAREYTYELVKGLTDTTREVLRNAMEKYTTTPGMTIGELGELLEGAFGPNRARLISVTEVSRAYAQSINMTQKSLADSGITMTRIWHTNKDGLVCEKVCQELDNKPESEWADRFPHGPAAHSACRCFLTLTAEKTGATVPASEKP